MTAKNTTKANFNMDNVERLTRGKRSGANIGSRAVGHHLRAFERDIYERALKDRYLVVDSKSRENLWNIWLKVAEAKGWQSLILLKDVNQNQGTIYHGENLIYLGDLAGAKKEIRACAKRMNS